MKPLSEMARVLAVARRVRSSNWRKRSPAPKCCRAMQRTKEHLLGASDIAINPFMNSLLRAAANQVSPLKLGLLPSEERYPQLAAWMQRLERNPGYERTTATVSRMHRDILNSTTPAAIGFHYPFAVHPGASYQLRPRASRNEKEEQNRLGSTHPEHSIDEQFRCTLSAHTVYAITQLKSSSLLRPFPPCFGERSIGPNAETVDKNVDKPQNACLPARLIVHVAHAH
jgi:hypothetical protein